MSSSRESIEDILEKEFSPKVHKKAVINHDIPTLEYGDITMDAENDRRRAKTDYFIEFGDDESMEAIYQTYRKNIPFYYLEALSQGYSSDEVLESLYSHRVNFSIEIEGALDVDNRLKEEYREDLSEMLEEEFWEKEDENGVQN